MAYLQAYLQLFLDIRLAKIKAFQHRKKLHINHNEGNDSEPPQGITIQAIFLQFPLNTYNA